jgi:hypothetical protein
MAVPGGATLAMGYERLGRADVYFEAIGLSLGLLVRESVALKREPVQTLWGAHRLTMAGTRPEFAEELRREYRVGEAAVETMLADLEEASHVLAPVCDPSAPNPQDGAWLRLRRRGAARSFAARFGRLRFAEYAKTRQWPNGLGAYLEAWRVFLAPSSRREPPGGRLYRLGLALQGLVALPSGQAGICGLLAARFEALGGQVVRAPITAIGPGQRPFVETDGRRLESEVLIVNARRPPGADGETDPDGDAASTETWAFAVPAQDVPESMGRFLLVSEDEGETGWAITRVRLPDESGREGLIVSFRQTSAAHRASGTAEFTDRLGALMPFAAGNVDSLGKTSDRDIPDPIDPKVWKGPPWRARRSGLVQAGRAPIWWLADEDSPWLANGTPYRVAMAIDHLVSAR